MRQEPQASFATVNTVSNGLTMNPSRSGDKPPDPKSTMARLLALLDEMRSRKGRLPEELAPRVDHVLLVALAQGALDEAAKDVVLTAVASFLSWEDAYRQVLLAEIRHRRQRDEEPTDLEDVPNAGRPDA